MNSTVQSHRQRTIRYSAWIGAFCIIVALALSAWLPAYVAYLAVAVAVGLIGFTVALFQGFKRAWIGLVFLALAVLGEQKARHGFVPHNIPISHEWLSVFQFMTVMLGTLFLFVLVYSYFFRHRKNDSVAEPSAPPNGGPAEPLGNSGVSGGPPSVS